MNDTRIFFVTDSKVDNEEIFDIYEEAVGNFNHGLSEENSPRLYVAFVKYAYQENYEDDETVIWNYEDKADTFEIVKVLKGTE